MLMEMLYFLISPLAVTDGRYTVTRTDGDTEAVFTFAKGQTLPVEVTWTSRTRQVEIEVKQS